MAVVKRAPSRAEGGLSAVRRRRGPCTPSAAAAVAAARSYGVRIGSMKAYKRLDGIGKGAFGVVWKARDRRTGEEVAIKSVRAGPGAGDALLREASLLAACRGNPAVVGLREVARGARTDELHLVMDFAGPDNLQDVLAARRRRPLSESEARGAMRQLLAGAEMMHSRGVVHCDLKPGNVLVGEHDGRIKICDLGFARSVAVPLPQPRDTRALRGTLCYSSPEQLLGDKDCGAAVDVWALGCVMAELVTGKPLFREENEVQQAITIIRLLGVTDDVSAMALGVSTPSQLREMVPEERLSQTGFDVLRGLLDFDPKDRLTAAAALQLPWFAAKDEGSASLAAL